MGKFDSGSEASRSVSPGRRGGRQAEGGDERQVSNSPRRGRSPLSPRDGGRDGGRDGRRGGDRRGGDRSNNRRGRDWPPPENENARSVYVKGYPLNWRSRDLFELFERAGPVDRVDMKEDYAFVIFKGTDAMLAVKELHGEPFKNDRLLVQISKDAEVTKKAAPQKRSKILFVVNFNKVTTTESDVKKFFDGFGLDHVEMWQGGKGIANKNYCFVTMNSEEDAAEARDALDGTYLGDRQVTVEFRTSTRTPEDVRRDRARERREGRRDDRDGRGRSGFDRRDRDSDNGRWRDRDDDRDRDRNRDRDGRRDDRDRRDRWRDDSGDRYRDSGRRDDRDRRRDSPDRRGRSSRDTPRDYGRGR